VVTDLPTRCLLTSDVNAVVFSLLRGGSINQLELEVDPLALCLNLIRIIKWPGIETQANLEVDVLDVAVHGGQIRQLQVVRGE